jgi:parallel beta-helix repeat protein
MAGIFLESSSGASINLNTISGHSNSIHLGNSSPNIGGNIISYNKYHGIYIGAGSLPNMEQNLAGSPPNVYPLSGYNDIKENGGTTTGGPIDNDGSEIFFFSSNAILEDGCNSICDDRSPGGEHPPYNTKLLMNGFALQQIEVYAGGNYWCDNPLYPLEERFGNLSVHLDPVLPGPCEIPQGGGEDFLVMKSFSGEVIDTFF